MKKTFCDICRREKLNLEVTPILRDLSLSEKLHYNLSEVCVECIDDVALLVQKHVDSKVN